MSHDKVPAFMDSTLRAVHFQCHRLHSRHLMTTAQEDSLRLRVSLKDLCTAAATKPIVLHQRRLISPASRSGHRGGTRTARRERKVARQVLTRICTPPCRNHNWILQGPGNLSLILNTSTMHTAMTFTIRLPLNLPLDMTPQGHFSHGATIRQNMVHPWTPKSKLNV